MIVHISWDPVLIGISYLVAFIASFVSLDSAGKVQVSSRRQSIFWRLSSGATLGMGIWSMHCIGMLAMKMNMPMNYHLIPTICSLFVALLTATLALNIAISSDTLSAKRLIIATVILSSGVVSMHYMGIAAIIGHSTITWNLTLVFWSLIIAIVASGVGLWLAFNLRLNTRWVFVSRLAAALVMGVAICAMHYTGMAAASFTHYGPKYVGGLSELNLSIWVSATTLIILGIMLIISMVDSQLRTTKLTENLRHLNAQLVLQTQVDALTGLANRTQIDSRLNTWIQYAELHHKRFALVFMDLDRFKVVNDTWGHHVGDRLLIAAAQRIQSCLDETMTLARLGGDEFILLAPGCDKDEIGRLLERISRAVKAPFLLSGHVVQVSLSAGASLYPDHALSLHELKVKADAAMYHVKQKGRNGWAIYQPDMATLMNAPPALLQELSMALERDQYELWYQPKYVAEDRTLIGFEALLRWHHPEQGLLSPDAFLPVLEQTGMIVPVGRWVIHQACSQLAEWKRQGHPEWTLAVNLSPLQFEQNDLVDEVCGALAHYQVSPTRLTLEITENAALKDLARSAEILTTLSEAGITVSIDDFGTGYSNMLMLKSLPARELKIDKIFIKDIGESNKNSKIVSTIIDIAHSMNMRVVAEGIETSEQESLLTEMGCGVLQGFLYAKPLPAEHIPLLIQRDTVVKQIKKLPPVNREQYTLNTSSCRNALSERGTKSVLK